MSDLLLCVFELAALKFLHLLEFPDMYWLYVLLTACLSTESFLRLFMKFIGTSIKHAGDFPLVGWGYLKNNLPSHPTSLWVFSVFLNFSTMSKEHRPLQT